MAERKHPPLNVITVCDRFRVKAYSLAQDVHFVFQAHGSMGPNRPAEFTCHIYDSATLSHSAAIEPDTVTTDTPGIVRTCATGRTLEELAHNLDWAHKPSEMALLKSLLATRDQTNCREKVGDLVLLVLTPEEREKQTQLMLHRFKTVRDEQEAHLLRAATAAIRAAAEESEQLAQFGLRQDVSPKLDAVTVR